jgi:hypothetical protein
MNDKQYWDNVMQRYFAGCNDKDVLQNKPKCKKYLTLKIPKMKSDFKLTGLSKQQSFTCEPLNNENIFWAKNGLGEQKFNELWNYCKGNWSDKKIAEIQHDGLNNDGIPINPVVVGIRES